MDVIRKFSGQYEFLSNFYECAFEYDGYIFKTAEHAYQAQKTIDDVDFEKVRNTETAGQAKRLGGKIYNRRDWDEVKLGIMYQIVWAKFTNDREMGKKLLATMPSQLVEGNNWGDIFWGSCNGVGENHLGEILMRVREQLASSGSMNQ